MARIVMNTYMVRYPLGGNLSWALQWIIGLQRLGHDVYIVEKSGYPNACFDLPRERMTDDCTYGVATVHALLTRFGLQDSWCYVDANGTYHGLSRQRVEALVSTADLFLDMGTHGLGMEGTWLDEAANARLRVLVATEPGLTQMRMELALAAGAARLRALKGLVGGLAALGGQEKGGAGGDQTYCELVVRCTADFVRAEVRDRPFDFAEH